MTPIVTANAALDADREHDDPAIWITRLLDDVVLARARQLEAEGPRGRKLRGVAGRATTAADVIDRALARIARRNPVLNAFTAVTAERARSPAAEFDAAMMRVRRSVRLPACRLR